MARKGKFQIASEYYLLRALLWFLGFVPRKAAVASGLLIARLSYLGLWKLRRIGMRNAELAFPQTSKRERQRLVLGCFKSLGRQLVELSRFHKATRRDLGRIVEYQSQERDREKFQEARAQRRGIIFLAPHLGGWEMLAFALSALHDEPGSYLARRLDNPRIEAMMEKIRSRFGVQPIDKEDAALPALELLRRGGVLGVMADLNSLRNEGIFVPFFGHLACTTAGVAALVMRTNALAMPVCAPWDATKGRYVLRFGPALEFESTSDRRRDAERFTARFTRVFEEMVRDYPDQWYWIHKRWKTRPEGEPDLYQT